MGMINLYVTDQDVHLSKICYNCMIFTELFLKSIVSYPLNSTNKTHFFIYISCFLLFFLKLLLHNNITFSLHTHTNRLYLPYMMTLMHPHTCNIGGTDACACSTVSH